MICVLDTSAAVTVVLKRQEAAFIAGLLGQAEWVISPELFVAEAANVFWKYHLHSGLEKDRCAKFLADAVALPDDLVRMEVLSREAFSLACRLKITACDALYLVLARRHDACLLSLDGRLNTAAARESIMMPEAPSPAEGGDDTTGD